MADEFKFPEEFNKKIDDMFKGVETIQKETRQTRNELIDVKAKVEKIEKAPPSAAPQKKDQSNNDYRKLFSSEDDSQTKEEVESLRSEIQSLKQRDQERDKNSQFAQECAEWDAKTNSEVPLIRDQKFAKEVTDSLASDPTAVHGKDAQGRIVFKPDAVYRHAIKVENKWLKEDHQETMNKFETLNVGGFGQSRRVVKEEVTEVQEEIANRLGIDSKRAREIYKPWNQSNKKQTLQNGRPGVNIYKTTTLGSMQSK